MTMQLFKKRRKAKMVVVPPPPPPVAEISECQNVGGRVVCRRAFVQTDQWRRQPIA